MPITKLSFSNVGPFEEVEFEFDSAGQRIHGAEQFGEVVGAVGAG